MDAISRDLLVRRISRRAIGALVLGVALVFTARAGADSITLSLPDIGNFTGFQDFNTADTFTGSGFVGIYPNLPNTHANQNPSASFAHLFGLEYYNGVFSETELQASLAGLLGTTINSAYLNFSLNSGSGGSESVKITSFTTAGTLGFNTSAPDNLGSLTAVGITGGANSIDVTSLVAAAVQANQSWLGLYLTPQGPGDSQLWTYAYDFVAGDVVPNAPGLQIVINYTSHNSPPVSVPETASTLLLLAIGLGSLRCAAVRLKLQPD